MFALGLGHSSEKEKRFGGLAAPMKRSSLRWSDALSKPVFRFFSGLPRGIESWRSGTAVLRTWAQVARLESSQPLSLPSEAIERAPALCSHSRCLKRGILDTRNMCDHWLKLLGLEGWAANNAFQSDGPRFARPTAERGR